MTGSFISVDRAAAELNLHPKTVRRYIRDGRLKAARIGKSYRIARGELDAFAGVVRGSADLRVTARATCIVEVPGLTAGQAERTTSLLHAAAMTSDAETPPLHLETVFDPTVGVLKVVAIGEAADVGKLLEMLHLQTRGQQ